MEAMVRTLKIKLCDVSPEVDEELTLTQQAYVAACNFVSEYIFTHEMLLTQRILHDRLYQTIRREFNLKSQMAQSVIRTVIAKYKTVNTNNVEKYRRLNRHYFRLYGENDVYDVYNNLHYLERPIVFKKPFAQYVYKRDFTVKTDNRVSLTTPNGRTELLAHFDVLYYEQYLDGTWTFGGPQLLKRNDAWYLYLPVSKDTEAFNVEDVTHVVGIDLGLRHLATTYDEQGETTFFSGKRIAKTRRNYRRLRQELQSKNTTASKRRLEAINQRENRWMADINHQITKALVDRYGAHTLFVLEDLRCIREDTNLQSPKGHRTDMNSWAFYDFAQKLAYKAQVIHSSVVTVDAHYTSQRCPKCGTIDKAHRDHEQHHYHCANCGYQSNDDRVGAMNIQELGKQYVSGVPAPKFEKIDPDEY